MKERVYQPAYEPVRSVLAFFVIVVTAGVVARPALAAKPHAEVVATDAIAKAEADYLAMNFASGAARLDKALRGCSPAKCSPDTQAALLRDIGTMEFRAGDRGFATKAFGDALKLQPSIDLNPSYDSPDVRAVWNATKAGVAPSAAPAAPPPPPPVVAAPPPPPAPPAPPPPPPVPPPPTFPQPKGDFTHVPVPEQTIDTPLPVYIEGGPAGVYHVLVRYKSSQESPDAEWMHTDLTHVGHGWGGLIPCGAVLPGTTRYFIQAYNADMDPVGSNGDAKNPYQVPIREALAGPAPHLPNHVPPRGCHEKPKPAPIVAKAAPVPVPVAAPVESPAAQAAPAEEAKAEEAPEAPRALAPLHRFWFGVNVHLDFMQLPSGTGLCKLSDSTALPLNDKHIFCTDSSGTDFPQANAQGRIVNQALATPATSGVSDGGISPANFRIFASLDYALNSNFLVGVRGGYVLNRYPGVAAIDHNYAFSTGLYVEARVTAILGKDALRKGGFAPLAFLGGGISAFDAHTSGTATCAPGTPTSVTACFPAGAGGSSAAPPPVNVNFWWSNGPAFADLGGGLRYAPVPQLGFIVAARLNLSIGNNGVIPTLGPEVGVQLGF